MAKPITWRTIAGPTFNNSAGGQAINAFQGAGRGFSDLTDSLFKTQDRIDAGFTNEAIKQALQTGQVDPNLNPRADTARVYEALLGKQKFESDLETAETNRANLRADTAYTLENTKKLEFENSDEWRKMLTDEKLAQIERWQNEAKNAAERNRLEALRINLLQDQQNETIRVRDAQRAAETQFADAVRTRAAEIVPQEVGQARTNYGNRIGSEVLRMKEEGATQQEIDAAVARWALSDQQAGLETVKNLATQRASEQVLAEIQANPARAAALGLTGEQYAQTTPGGLIANIEAEQLRLAGERQAAADELAKYESATLDSAASGNETTGIIMDPTAPQGYRIGSAEEAKGNKATKAEYKAIIEEAGLTKELEDEIDTVWGYTKGNKSILREILKLPGLTGEGFRQLATDYQDGLVNYASDGRVAALRQAAELPVSLSGVQSRIANDSLDAAFLREDKPTESVIKSTEDPQLKSQAVAALEEIQRLRQARPNMDPRQKKILDRFESIFKDGSVSATNAAFTSRELTKTYDDEEIVKELTEWNNYQKRNGYK